MAVQTVEKEEDKLLSHHTHTYILYKSRWFMLAVVVMFNISNAIIWITFAPVTNYAASFFDISETSVNYFSLVYFIASVPCCGVSWWMIETLGFKFSVIFGTCVNAIGALIRILGVYAFAEAKTKFTVVLVGQILAACTQPLVLSMPTKLAALWFGDHERTISNTIASMANPLGVLIANAFATVIVHNEDDVKLMMLLFGLPAIISALMAVLGFWTSKPPTPPSASALIEPVSFFTGLKVVFKSKPFLILAFSTGTGIASFSALTTFLQQLICPKGYSNTIAALCGALVIVGGFVGAGLTGVYIDKTRKYIDIAKPLALGLSLSVAAIVISSSLRDLPAFIALSFTLFGFFGLGLLPVMLELGVECVYPVDEATSSGVQWVVGQVIGCIMVMGSLAAAPKLTPNEVKRSTCIVKGQSNLDPVDFMNPTIVMVCFSVFSALVFVMFFDTPYKRLNAEKQINHSEVVTEENMPHVT